MRRLAHTSELVTKRHQTLAILIMVHAIIKSGIAEIQNISIANVWCRLVINSPVLYVPSV